MKKIDKSFVGETFLKPGESYEVILASLINFSIFVEVCRNLCRFVLVMLICLNVCNRMA